MEENLSKLIFDKINGWSPSHNLDYVNSPEFQENFPQIDTEGQHLIYAAAEYSPTPFCPLRFQSNYRKVCNIVLAAMAPFPYDRKYLEKFISKDGYITVYRGTDKAETDKAKAGDVEDLGHYWTVSRERAAHYAARFRRVKHFWEGRVMKLTIPYNLIKVIPRLPPYAKEEDLTEATVWEVRFSPPEVWPHKKQFKVFRNWVLIPSKKKIL